MAISKIETNRLILRKFEEKDIQALYLLLKDEEVNTFLPWYTVKNIKDTEDFYKKHFANKEYCFAICLKENDKLIGYIKVDMDDSHDLGYALHKEFWHKGFATEAAIACKEYAFQELNFDEVYSIIRDSNVASQNVARRNGMVGVDTLVKHYRGVEMPHIVFRVSRGNNFKK